MNLKDNDLETLEQQVLELISEVQKLQTTENRLRDSLRVESSRADSSESARDAAKRATIEVRTEATAVTACANQTVAELSRTRADLIAVKMQLDIVERERAMLEKRCMELSMQGSTAEQELHQLRPLQASQATLQRQYSELQLRVQRATEEAQAEAAQLRAELRNVERCAAGGAELRERARLAAAAHARERRLIEAELRHTAEELRKANVQIGHLKIALSESQQRCAELSKNDVYKGSSWEIDVVTELRATLQAEQAGARQLERALATALADNALLASQVANTDRGDAFTGCTANTTPPPASTNITAVDSFLN